MSRQTIRWLLGELPDLVRRGLLTEETAERLRVHYAARLGAERTHVLLAVLGTLGAALIGGGIILILAHNWAEIPRPGRAAIAMGLLLAAQAFALWVAARRPQSTPLREGSAILVVLAIGASIALISQTYHTLGDLDGFLQACLVLTLPVIYLMSSRLAAMVYWIGLPVWLAAGYHHPLQSGRFLGLCLLAGLTVPYLTELARRPLGDRWRHTLFWVVALALGMAVLVQVGRGYRAADVVLASGLFASMCGWTLRRGSGLEAESQRAETARRRVDAAGQGVHPAALPFLVVGAAGTGVLLLWHSYRDSWRWLWRSVERGGVRGIQDGSVELLTAWLTAVAFVVPATLFAVRFARRRYWAAAAVSALPAVLGVGLALSRLSVSAVDALAAPDGGPATDGHGAEMILVNVYGLALALLVLQLGMQRDRLAVANAGLLLLGALLAARFFDADWSFLVRGVAFIVLGSIFLAANVWMLRRRRASA